jgi:hypothetical protein
MRRSVATVIFVSLLCGNTTIGQALDPIPAKDVLERHRRTIADVYDLDKTLPTRQWSEKISEMRIW